MPLHLTRLPRSQPIPLVKHPLPITMLVADDKSNLLQCTSNMRGGSNINRLGFSSIGVASPVSGDLVANLPVALLAQPSVSFGS